MSKEESPSLGGARKKNGHKLTCSCHICDNMKKKAQRGGYEEEAMRKEERRRGVTQKKNGHKRDCNCPICKNMRNAHKRISGGDYKEIPGEPDAGILDAGILDAGIPDKPDEGKETAATPEEYPAGGTRRRRRKNRLTRRKKRRSRKFF